MFKLLQCYLARYIANKKKEKEEKEPDTYSKKEKKYRKDLTIWGI